MSRPITKGSTDQSTVIRIVDSTDGTPETGVVFNTAGIDLWYRREGATKTSITEATLAALDTAHTDGGFLHIGDGYYRLDLPDAAFATGADGVAIGGTVTGMVVVGAYHPLIGANLQDAAGLGLSRLDATIGSRASQTSLDAVDDLLDTEVLAIYDRLGAPAGASHAADAAAIKAQVAAIEADTQDLQARTPAALTAAGNMKSDMLAVDGSTGAATKAKKGFNLEIAGTVGALSTTTAIIASALDPASAVNEQFNSRIMIFEDDTTTAALRGQAKDITNFVHATQTFTVTAFTTAPASGDKFRIV